MQQDSYNEHLQQQYAATRRVAPASPAAVATPRDPVAQLKDLAELHASGVLTDEELAVAKAKVLADNDDPT